MKFVVLLGLGLLLACVPQSDPAPIEEESPVEIEVAALPNLGPAPELENEIWLNTDRPLRLAELRGKVVLIEMWTFG